MEVIRTRASRKRDAMSGTGEELEALVAPAVAGDRGALQRLTAKIYPAVLRYSRVRISGSRTPTAEDVAQDACLAIATSISKYQDQGRPFMAYVYGVAAHKVADARRALSRDLSSPTDEVLDRVSGDANPEDWALWNDGGNRARLLLDSLSDKARDILILRVFVGLSAEETAAAVGSTPGAVRVAQHRALATLRKKIEQGEGL